MLVALIGAERAVQHDAGVVDEDVGAAELALDAVGRGERATSRSVTSASIAIAPSPSSCGQRLDAVGAAGQQRDAVAVGGERAGGRLADARRGAGDDRDAAGVLIVLMP